MVSNVSISSISLWIVEIQTSEDFGQYDNNYDNLTLYDQSIGWGVYN